MNAQPTNPTQETPAEPQGKTSYRDDPRYLEAQEMLGEFELAGVPVYRKDILNERRPSLLVGKVSFLQLKPELKKVEVDPEWGKAQVDAGENPHKVEWDGEKYVMPFTIVKTMGFFSDEYRTSVVPASIRFRPDCSKGPRVFPRCAMRTHYFSSRKRGGATGREAHALPIYSAVLTLHEDEYVSPPTVENPITLDVAFFPLIERDRKDKSQIRVIVAAVHPTDKYVVWDDSLEFNPANYGKPIRVSVMREMRTRVICMPYSEELHRVLQLALGSDMEVSAKRVELKDDEFQYGSRVLSIYEVLKLHGIVPDMLLHSVKGKFRDFAKKYFPDTDPVLARYRELGQDPGESVILRGNVWTRGNAAFQRLISLLESKAEETEEREESETPPEAAAAATSQAETPQG